MKGQNNLTEMYSAIKAEYTIPDDPRTKSDEQLIKKLQDTERVSLYIISYSSSSPLL